MNQRPEQALTNPCGASVTRTSIRKAGTVEQSPNPPLSSRVTLIALLVAALGVPTAAGVALSDQVAAHPWRSAAIALAYVSILFICGLVAKVWQQLEAGVVGYVASSIRFFVTARVSKFNHTYRRNLFYRHRDFDVKGLTTQGVFTLALQQVFVDLAVAPQPAHAASANPLRQPHIEPGTRYTLWDYLHEEAKAGRHLAIIGAPGSGKTTLLKHAVLTLTNPRRSSARKHLPKALPVFLALREHADSIMKREGFELAQAIADDFQKSSDHVIPKEWFQKHLRRGNCLVMLDGLDEVADLTTRQSVVAWIDRQTERYGNNRFIVTSRPFGYRSNPLAHFTVLEAQPFTYSQITQFVNNWYTANEIMSSQRDDPGVRLTARQNAAHLLAALREAPALEELAVNPLLLTMISTVHRYRGSLPGRRVELYAEIFEVFLGKRRAASGISSNLTPAQKQRVLLPLAYHMMKHNTREIAISSASVLINPTLQLVDPTMSGESFLREIEELSGLLIEREQGVYGFSHLTFQEYLAASHIREFKSDAELIDRVDDSWWHEVIRLYSAQTDASRIIAACLEKRPMTPLTLTLAIECLSEAREVSVAIRTRVQDMLNRDIEHPDPAQREAVVEARLLLRIRRFLPLGDHSSIDSEPISNAEYQLFVDELGVPAYAAAGWRDDRYRRGTGHEPVTGVQYSHAVLFCSWLEARFNGAQTYRLVSSSDLSSNDAQVHAIIRQNFATVRPWLADGSIYSDCGQDSGMNRAMVNSETRLSYDFLCRLMADIFNTRLRMAIAEGRVIDQDKVVSKMRLYITWQEIASKVLYMFGCNVFSRMLSVEMLAKDDRNELWTAPLSGLQLLYRKRSSRRATSDSVEDDISFNDAVVFTGLSDDVAFGSFSIASGQVESDGSEDGYYVVLELDIVAIEEVDYLNDSEPDQSNIGLYHTTIRFPLCVALRAFASDVTTDVLMTSRMSLSNTLSRSAYRDALQALRFWFRRDNDLHDTMTFLQGHNFETRLQSAVYLRQHIFEFAICWILIDLHAKPRRYSTRRSMVTGGWKRILTSIGSWRRKSDDFGKLDLDLYRAIVALNAWIDYVEGVEAPTEGIWLVEERRSLGDHSGDSILVDQVPSRLPNR